MNLSMLCIHQLRRRVYVCVGRVVHVNSDDACVCVCVCVCGYIDFNVKEMEMEEERERERGM